MKIVWPSICLVSFVASTAVAQGNVSVQGSGDHSYAAPFACSYSASGVMASVSLAPCTSDDQPGANRYYGNSYTSGTAAHASVQGGVVSADATASVHGTGSLSLDSPVGHVTTDASASWNDILHITAPSGVNVNSVGVTFGVSGSGLQSPNMDSFYYAGADNAADATLQFTYGSGSYSSTNVWNALTVSDVSAITGQPMNGGPADAYVQSTDVFGTNLFQEFALGGGSDLNLWWSVLATGDAQIGQIQSGEDNQARGYARGTGGIVNVQFFDQNHQDITSQVQYNFENGAMLTPSTVPEPSSFALLGTGLIGIIPLGLRRRKKPLYR
jgi:hypothetical protein